MNESGCMFEIEFRPHSGIDFGGGYWLDGDFGKRIECLRRGLREGWDESVGDGGGSVG